MGGEQEGCFQDLGGTEHCGAQFYGSVIKGNALSLNKGAFLSTLNGLALFRKMQQKEISWKVRHSFARIWDPLRMSSAAFDLWEGVNRGGCVIYAGAALLLGPSSSCTTTGPNVYVYLSEKAPVFWPLS